MHKITFFNQSIGLFLLKKEQGFLTPEQLDDELELQTGCRFGDKENCKNLIANITDIFMSNKLQVEIENLFASHCINDVDRKDFSSRHITNPFIDFACRDADGVLIVPCTVRVFMETRKVVLKLYNTEFSGHGVDNVKECIDRAIFVFNEVTALINNNKSVT